MEGQIVMDTDNVVYLKRCCGDRVPLSRYLGILIGYRVRLEQHCDGSFRIVPVNREDARANKSHLPVQHGDRQRAWYGSLGEGREVATCRICGQPVGGM